jgi:saccharopine dehydrogenase (NAD+, L-lysine-forming)
MTTKIETDKIETTKTETTKAGWMIYGATGFTGRLVAREAIALGERPLLAGRSAEKVRRVAEELGLPWVAFDLGDRAAAVAALRGVELVLLAAGPFDGLAQPMMDACIEARTHYTDLDNELPVFRAAEERDARARERGVAIVPGVGFGTIATGSLVKRVVAALPDATRLECALHIATTDAGPATGESGLAAVRMGGRIRRGGRLVEHPLGAGGREIPFADRSRRASPVPTGDLEAAWMDTHIPDIVVYGTALPGGFVQRAGIAVLRRLLWIGAIRRAAGSVREGRGGDAHCQAWACATNARGQTVEARLETGEGFAFTAAAAARAVAVIRRAPAPGAHAAATVLGAAFIESVPDVRISVSRQRAAVANPSLEVRS